MGHILITGCELLINSKGEVTIKIECNGQRGKEMGIEPYF